MFYSSSDNKGWFVPVLKNRRKLASHSNDESQNNIEYTDEYTEENAKADVDFLRTTALTKSNMTIFEQKLKATMNYRKSICNDANIDLLERFPYFFTHPESVNYHFKSIFCITAELQYQSFITRF